MPDVQHYNMRVSQFDREVRVGCVQIQNAGELPLEFATFVSKPGQIKLVLVGATGKPGSSDSNVEIDAFRFRDGLEAFEIDVEWWAKERKSRATLPDGVRFDENVLAVQHAPADWEHDAYPQSNRKFVHVYRGPKQGVIIRWLARTGTILDHPLFKPLTENLRIVSGQWTTKAPAVKPKADQRAAVKGVPLPADTRAEIEESVVRARSSLELGRVSKPKKVAEAIYHAIDGVRSRKRVGKKELTLIAIECGALWGQALCDATGWKWKRLEYGQGQGTLAVCSPDGSHAVPPLTVIHDLVTNRKSANNSLLLFNMIAAGKLPPSRKCSYTMLK